MTNLHNVDWSKIPAPPDDGAADHLVGAAVASAALPATDGSTVDLSKLPGRTVLYVYPKTGRPDVPLPEGWDQIPGARGCTPQSCAFRDHFEDLKTLGVEHLFGLSVQDTADQKEAAERLHLPFPLLSDAQFQFADAMRLPILSAPGIRLLRRMTMVIDDGRVTHVFYPVVRPDQNAEAVANWLRSQTQGCGSVLLR